jgi:hypothetical protein
MSETEQPTVKTCSKCGREKTLDLFGADKSNAIDHKRADCKECQNKSAKDRREKNKRAKLLTTMQKYDHRSKKLKEINDLITSRSVITADDDTLSEYANILREAIAEIEYVVNLKRNDIITISVISDFDLTGDVNTKVFEGAVKQSLENAIYSTTQKLSSQLYMEIIKSSDRKIFIKYSDRTNTYTDDVIRTIKLSMQHDNINHVVRID